MSFNNVHTYTVLTRTIIRDLGSDYHTYTVLIRTIIRDLGSDYHTYTVLTEIEIKFSRSPIMIKTVHMRYIKKENMHCLDNFPACITALNSANVYINITFCICHLTMWIFFVLLPISLCILCIRLTPSRIHLHFTRKVPTMLSTRISRDCLSMKIDCKNSATCKSWQFLWIVHFWLPLRIL
jgi:hypothetical protein